MLMYLYALNHDDVRSRCESLEVSVEAKHITTEGDGGISLVDDSVVEGDIMEADNDDVSCARLALQNSILVYSMADKYGIPGLKLLAIDHFVTRVRTIAWAPTDLREIIEMVYGTTPDIDSATHSFAFASRNSRTCCIWIGSNRRLSSLISSVLTYCVIFILYQFLPSDGVHIWDGELEFDTEFWFDGI